MFADIHPDAVLFREGAIDKETALHEIVETACRVHNLPDCDAILTGVIDREAKLSTGIGLEIAVPHCLTSQVDHIVLVPMLIPEGIDYNAVDGLPVRLLFLIISPRHDVSAHINCLSTISHAVSDEKTRKKLLSAESAGELYDTLTAIKLWT